ncbi:MAG: thioredoxin domain-containing protein [Bacteriovoracaceae bacterium]|jgi:uncharacterized protein|nr:thioredoxin domain-containing protein [Bacteriovoracaceae bacterium]
MELAPKFNKLKEESSLYLKQHNQNPVKWFPYGPEALDKAREENKPIFLSIGYSSCHWCHVMAHESFEDQKTADFLNEHFVAIKVDKEEHPDIDQYYQLACQVVTGRGGWPLSAFLTPKMEPFFVGTYYPSQSSEGVPSFLEVLSELNRAYSDEQATIEDNALKITTAIKDGVRPPQKVDYEGDFPSPQSIAKALEQHQDNTNGGHGGAPKFPHFSYLNWGFEQIVEGMIDQKSTDFYKFTLDRILMGGMFDQAKGGVHRYSVDEKWLVPHFEKMLYDQAGLLSTLSKASIVHPSPLVLDGLLTTLDYLETEMYCEEKGHFFSAQDADSEGVEGLYFTFKEDEFEAALMEFGSDQAVENIDLLKKWFSIEADGNFENGLNVLALNYELREEFITEKNWPIIRDAKSALLESRKQRIPPKTDNKGVCSWNYMVLCSLIDVFQYCRIDVIKRRASEIITKIVSPMQHAFLTTGEDGKSHLSHTTSKNTGVPLFEDYAFFTEAQIRMYEISGNEYFKDNALETIKCLLEEFFDDGKFLSRSKLYNDTEPYPNLALEAFDNSFRSPLMSFMGTLRRSALIFNDRELLEKFELIRETSIQNILLSPVSAGEGLRTFTYPEPVYRKLSLPKSWLDNTDFLFFISNFMPRFILDCKNTDDKWQICNSKECELSGEGYQEFLKVFAPEKVEDTE